MRRNGRDPVAAFPREEYLFRRVPLGLWEDKSDPLEVNAIELPDMSVGRSWFGHPEWLRIHEGTYYAGWGVIGFQVGAIPPEQWKDGYPSFTFEPVHAPEELNYPHSEVRVSDRGVRVILQDALPDDIHLKWREQLLRRTEVFLRPHQGATIRQHAPTSHHPELPIPPGEPE
jgi:hypothetical protein